MLAVVCLVACGCQHNWNIDDAYHWKSYETFAESDLGGDEDDELRLQGLSAHLRDIEDETVPDVFGRESVFQVFRGFIRPGDTSRDIRDVLGDVDWLTGAQIQFVGGIGGFIPVEYYNDEIEYMLSVVPFAENRGADPGGFYFCLHGIHYHNEGAMESALAFLRGELNDDDAYLVEYAIWYPGADRPYGKSVLTRSYTERFTKRGHGITSNP